MPDDVPQKQSWWTTLPGVLTGFAAVLGAVSGLIVAWNSLDIDKPGADTAAQQAPKPDSGPRPSDPPFTSQRSPVQAPIAANQKPIASLPKLSIKNTSERLTADKWAWRIFLDGDQESLAQVRCVTYELHPTFPDRIQSRCDRHNNFALSSEGWGVFAVGVTIELVSGEKLTRTHMLRFE